MNLIHLKDLEFIPASHENPKLPAVFKKLLYRLDPLSPRFLQMVNWANLRVGASFRPHFHQDMEEIFILLRGKARMRIEQEQAEVNSESVVVIPAGKIHELTNIGQEEVEYIVIGASQGKGGKTVVI
jgi:quercetin dioxygenase-like cupin family protein